MIVTIITFKYVFDSEPSMEICRNRKVAETFLREIGYEKYEENLWFKNTTFSATLEDKEVIE